MRQISAGFSLFELVVALLLISMVAAIAVPLYGNTVANGRIRTEVNALFHAIHAARKESLMRREVVSICPSTNGNLCSANLDWSSGWIMFTNQDRDEPPQLDAGEPLLQVHRVAAEVRIQANRRGLTLRATGKRATNGTIRFCDRSARGTARALIISYTGRPRVARQDSRGEQYACQV